MYIIIIPNHQVCTISAQFHWSKADSKRYLYVGLFSLLCGFLSCVSDSPALTEIKSINKEIFVCVEVLRPSQPNGVISSAVSLPNHTFTGQA